MEKIIRLDKRRTMLYKDFIQQAKKLTKAKGEFKTVEDNLRDYIQVTENGSPVIRQVTYRDCCEILTDIYMDNQEVQRGGYSGYASESRNKITAKTLFKIIDTISVP